MTRAVVGGINPVDNEFYPLAVNSQGIAQIDTSGIPKPEEWEFGSWTPVYGSTDPSGSAEIIYGRQSGWWAKLGNMVWLKCMINTSNVVITGARGALMITGAPFTWQSDTAAASSAGSSVSYFNEWTPLDYPTQVLTQGAKLYHLVRGFKQQTYGFFDFSDLREGAIPNANDMQFSHWGYITSESTPAEMSFDEYLALRNAETAADTQ